MMILCIGGGKDRQMIDTKDGVNVFYNAVYSELECVCAQLPMAETFTHTEETYIFREFGCDRERFGLWLAEEYHNASLMTILRLLMDSYGASNKGE